MIKYRLLCKSLEYNECVERITVAMERDSRITDYHIACDGSVYKGWVLVDEED